MKFFIITIFLSFLIILSINCNDNKPNECDAFRADMEQILTSFKEFVDANADKYPEGKEDNLSGFIDLVSRVPAIPLDFEVDANSTDCELVNRLRQEIYRVDTIKMELLGRGEGVMETVYWLRIKTDGAYALCFLEAHKEENSQLQSLIEFRFSETNYPSWQIIKNVPKNINIQENQAFLYQFYALEFYVDFLEGECGYGVDNNEPI